MAPGTRSGSTKLCSWTWFESLLLLLLVSGAITVIAGQLMRLHGELLCVRFAQALEHSRVVPAALRREVLTRDNHACRFCGATDSLHIDHIKPYSRGGSTTLDNLQALCASCNLRKGARSDRLARKQLMRWWRRARLRART